MNGGVTVWDRRGPRPKRVGMIFPQRQARWVYQNSKSRPATRSRNKHGRVVYT